MVLFSGLSNFKRIALAALVLLLSGCALLSPQIELISDISFKDPNFGRCVSGLGFQRTEDVVEIACFDQGISHVDELKYFPHLQRLSLVKNNIERIDLSDNPDLYRVNLKYNQLKELDLSDNPELVELTANNNQLTQLDVTENPKLTTLVVFNNQLTDFDTSHNPELDMISIEGNPVASTSPVKSSSQLPVPQVRVQEAGDIVRQGKRYLVVPAEVIKPQLTHFFGFRYSAAFPELTPGQQQRLRKLNHQLPITVRMTHPPIKDVQSGLVSRVSSWPDTMFLHDQNLAMWYFSDQTELVEGDWRFEILYDNQVLVSEPFVVDSEAKTKLERTFRTLADYKVYLQLKEKGEQLICEQQGYTQCLGLPLEQCITQAQQIKSDCFTMAQQEVPNIKSNKQFKQFMGYFVSCMGVVQAKQNDLQPKQFSQCLKNSED